MPIFSLKVLEQVRYRVEWTRQQEAIKRREEEEAERERGNIIIYKYSRTSFICHITM